MKFQHPAFEDVTVTVADESADDHLAAGWLPVDDDAALTEMPAKKAARKRA